MMKTIGQVWPQEQLYSGYGGEYNNYCQEYSGYSEYSEYNTGYNAHTELYSANIYESAYLLPENYYSLPPSPDYSSASSLTPSPPPYQPAYTNYYDHTAVLPSNTSTTSTTSTTASASSARVLLTGEIPPPRWPGWSLDVDVWWSLPGMVVELVSEEQIASGGTFITCHEREGGYHVII